LSNRRGETLIEVIVSFAILSLVMIGVTGLVASLLTMVVETRTITRATVLAQAGLINGVAMVNTRCDIRQEIGGTESLISDAEDANGLTRTVSMMHLEAAEQVESAALPRQTAIEK
jgi:hypothetical protein